MRRRRMDGVHLHWMRARAREPAGSEREEEEEEEEEEESRGQFFKTFLTASIWGDSCPRRLVRTWPAIDGARAVPAHQPASLATHEPEQ